MKNNIQQARQVLRDSFKSYYNWPDKDVNCVIEQILNKTADATRRDYHTTIDLVDDLLIKFNKKNPGQTPSTAAFIKAVKNRMIDDFRKNQRNRISFFDDILSISNNLTSSLNKSKIFKSKEEGHTAFFKWVETNLDLTKQEKIFFELLKVVITNDSVETFKEKELWHELIELAKDENIVLKNSAFRKLKERLLAKLKQGPEDLLHSFVSTSEKENNFFIEFLLTNLEELNIKNKLTAYRFSVEDFEGLKLLKTAFEINGYTFAPNRFPEVYFIDYIKQIDVNSPDSLGEYIYELDGNKQNLCSSSKEGYIVLYKNIIKNFSEKHNLSIDSIYYVVLMHEIGHWLCHQAFVTEDKDQIKWDMGYHNGNIKTHEALAQLIAYWACEQSEIYHKTLLALSPKINDKINTEEIYGCYELLKDKDIDEITSKIKELAKHFYLSDTEMFNFLKSNHKTMSEFIKAEFADTLEAKRNVWMTLLENCGELKFTPELDMIFIQAGLVENQTARGASLLKRLGIFKEDKNSEQEK